MTDTPLPAGAREFDFLFGAFDIVNERLVSRLTGCDEWERFPAVHEGWPILGGLGNVDTMRAERDGGAFHGSSLRLYNPATGDWSIYWTDSVACKLFPPVVGRFADGVGAFYGEDEEAGTPVLARFLWSGITADSARWQQAFSIDDGATWETNWVMTFTRRTGGGAR